MGVQVRGSASGRETGQCWRPEPPQKGMRKQAGPRGGPLQWTDYSENPGNKAVNLYFVSQTDFVLHTPYLKVSLVLFLFLVMSFGTVSLWQLS